MAPKPNPVPSRDALRALRNLALSPYAAFFGTVGGACSLAAVHYHSCRSLRLVEQVVETKRTLHTISRGQGLRQLNRMIEAAERGDDFTMHHGRPMKSQRRASSTATAEGASIEDSVPLTKSRDDMRADGQSNVPTNSHSTSDAGRYSTSQISLPSSRNPQEVRRVLRHPNNTTMPPRHYRDVAVQAIRKRQEQRWRIMLRTKPCGVKTLETRLQSQSEQETTDLHPLPAGQATGSGTEVVQIPSLSTEESLFFNFVFGKESQDDVYNSNVFHSMHPWNEVREPERAPRAREPSSPRQAVETAHSSTSSSDAGLAIDLSIDVPYIGPNTPVPDQVFSHSLTSKCDALHGHSLQVAHTGEVRYRYLFNSIAQRIHEFGKTRAFAGFEQTLAVYLKSKRDYDFVLVKLLVLEFARVFEAKHVLTTVRKLVRENLQGDNPNLQLVSLLYPRFGDDQDRITKYASYLPMRYLEEFCKLNPSPEDQKAELVKIIEGTRLCKIEVNEQLLLPLLRFLCNRGDVKQAQTLLDDIKIQYNIQTTLYTQAELMRGYAAVGNWWKVKTILDKSHADETSWKNVHGYAGLFARSLDEHMAKHSLTASCAFVMHAIDAAGLFPTSVISTRIVLGCVREKRYDLLRQYLNMVQREFPFLETGTKNSPFASALAGVWKETNATCEDILESCKAIAVNAIRDPFSRAFRGVISEAIARNLNARIEALADQGTFKFPKLGQYPSVRAFTESIRELVKHHHKIGFTSETRELAGDLVKQTKLMMQLEELFSGSFVADRAAKEDTEPVQAKPVKVTSGSVPRMSPGLRALRLPSAREIVTMLHKFYMSRHARGLPIDHTPTQFVCNRLTRQARHSDACDVMEAVFGSQWVQAPKGKAFGLDLLLQWLRLAFQVKSGGKVRDVIWAAVQSPPEIELSNEFLLVARVALPRTHFGAHKQARVNAVDEAEYLYWRLRWRRAQELNTKQTVYPVFSEWENMGRP